MVDGKAVEKLQRIQNLWLELAQTKPDSPEYATLTKKIHDLSADYHDVTDPPKTSDR
jgi:hypothetical protein